MIEEFTLPDLGEGLTESELVAWHVAVGDTVELNQIIAEVETAKAIVELPSPYAGVVAALHAEAGDDGGGRRAAHRLRGGRSDADVHGRSRDAAVAAASAAGRAGATRRPRSATAEPRRLRGRARASAGRPPRRARRARGIRSPRRSADDAAVRPKPLRHDVLHAPGDASTRPAERRTLDAARAQARARPRRRPRG